MMTYDTYGALVVIRLIKVVMGRCRDRGKEEQKDEEKGKAIFPVYDTRSTHARNNKP
jgi:hypothetical protein